MAAKQESVKPKTKTPGTTLETETKQSVRPKTKTTRTTHETEIKQEIKPTEPDDVAGAQSVRPKTKTTRTTPDRKIQQEKKPTEPDDEAGAAPGAQELVDESMKILIWDVNGIEARKTGIQTFIEEVDVMLLTRTLSTTANKYQVSPNFKSFFHPVQNGGVACFVKDSYLSENVTPSNGERGNVSILWVRISPTNCDCFSVIFGIIHFPPKIRDNTKIGYNRRNNTMTILNRDYVELRKIYPEVKFSICGNTDLCIKNGRIDFNLPKTENGQNDVVEIFLSDKKPTIENHNHDCVSNKLQSSFRKLTVKD